MEVIAAINLYNSLCIDTLESDYNIVQDCKPREMAIRWNNIGSNWIHIVDVNGYRENNPININIIKEIISTVNVPIQVAAGIEDIGLFEEILAAGAGRIVLDNSAIKHTEFIKKVLKEYPEKTVLLLNVDSGRTEIDNNYHESIIDITSDLKASGLRRVIYHDISKNYEFNYDDMMALSQNTKLPVIAAGKISNIETIKKLNQVSYCEGVNLEALILSKPLYSKTLDLYEIIKQVSAYPYIGDFYSREDVC